MASHLFVSIQKERGHLRIYFWGKKIFSYNTDRNFFSKNFFYRKNILLNEKNFQLGKGGEKERSILFVIPSLESKGGIESRLLKYAQQLRLVGIEPYFLSQYNEYTPILDNFTSYYLRFHDANFKKCFFELLKHKHFDAIEFQFGGTDYFEKLDIEALKKSHRVGGTIHSLFPLPENQLAKLDYCCLVSNSIPYNGHNKVFQLNGVIPHPVCWKFNEQRKALFISRLDKEKLPTLKVFLDFCLEKNIIPEIAAPLSNKNALAVRSLIKHEYGDTPSFIGAIDTLQFLKKHSQEYLFVAGVGQVPIEALSLGYPAFVCSHIGLEHSSFVSEKNFDVLRTYNFVIRRNKGVFPVSQELPDKNFHQLPAELLKKISFLEIFAEYRKIIRL